MDKVLLSSKKEEWYSPDKILSRARMIDDIGLDPCTSDLNPIGAKTFFTKEDNGLEQDWVGHGLVYVNPPYGRKTPVWLAKMVQEANKGAEVIALIAARPDTQYWHKYVFPTAHICFVKGRLKFLENVDGALLETDPAPFPSAVLYWGPRPYSFQAAFCPLGHIISPIGT